MQELDALAGSCGCAMAFLEGVAATAITLLSSLNINGVDLQAYMVEAERKFSCQVSVRTMNIGTAFF